MKAICSTYQTFTCVISSLPTYHSVVIECSYHHFIETKFFLIRYLFPNTILHLSLS